MTSNLRHTTPFHPVPTSTYSASPASSPLKRQKKMTVTQTYYLAHTARAKLSSEAARGDHDLRLLVGHANLLDSLMMDLQEAEREQEAWFNQTVKAAKDEPKHVVWRDTVVTEQDDDFADDDQESDNDDDDDDDVDMTVPLRRVRSPPPPTTATTSAIEIDSDADEDDVSEYDEDEDNSTLALVRTPSHQPPELIDDSDDSSDDESPVSPPQPSFDLSKSFVTSQSIVELKHKSHHQQRPTPQIIESEQALLEDGFYIPGRDRGVTPLVTTC